jgi:S1-C subfamily serine protease
VKFVYESLRKYGRVRKIEAGVLAQSITPTLAAGLSLARDWGVIVADVVPGGAAQAAGVKSGDILDTFDGSPIPNLPALSTAVFVHPLEQPVLLKVLRGNRELTLKVQAPEATRSLDRLSELTASETNLVRRLGIVASDLDDRARGLVPHLRKGPGVLVGARIQDATATESGLRAGDVIRTLNRIRVDSLGTLMSLVQELKPGDAVALQVEREGNLTFLAFELE